MRITSLDVVRIRTYLKDILCIDDDVRGIDEDYSSAPAFLQIDHAASFPEWITHVFTIRGLPSEPTAETLVDHVWWALEARRTYLACLKALFPITLPRWVYAIFKLGRYAAASMALLHLASEFPTIESDACRTCNCPSENLVHKFRRRDDIGERASRTHQWSRSEPLYLPSSLDPGGSGPRSPFPKYLHVTPTYLCWNAAP